MTIQVRPATPDPGDAAAFATLADMASHGIIASLLGPTWHDTLGRMFHDEATLYHHRQVWFSEEDGAIGGMMTGFTGEQRDAAAGATDRYFAHPSMANDHAWLRAVSRLEPIQRQIDTVPPAAWYIQFLAVSPERRGRGHGRVLLDHAIRFAREHAASTVELDVEAGNDAALATYGRAGFDIAATSPTIWFDLHDREIAMHRMVLPLR